MRSAIPRLLLCSSDERLLKNRCYLLKQALQKKNIEVQVFSDAQPSFKTRNDECDLILLCSADKSGAQGISVIDCSSPEKKLLSILSEADSIEKLGEDIFAWLQRRSLDMPVWGCILIGGMSRRMGQPKHLIRLPDGRTWLEKTAATLKDYVDQIVIAGNGMIPDTLISEVRLHDVIETNGPLAGILASLRWKPTVSWVVSACDMPLMTGSGIEWLLNQRKAGVWGTVPVHPVSGKLQPLFAFYDLRSRFLFEKLLAARDLRVSSICNEDKIATPLLPESIAAAWRNCNTPEDMSDIY